MIAQFGFDSLAFVKRLSAGGWDARQAEALAEALTANAFNEIVTRPDLDGLEGRLRSDLDGLESRLRSEAQAIKAELKGDIKDLDLRLTLRMGVMFGATIAILGTLITLS
ncbi:MAG: Coiled-coil protein 90-like [Sphingomonadales bacterium]|jgi:hypothetical protein|nr:Coiled-coil protein 90-like [Sphingomonadales bacterium]